MKKMYLRAAALVMGLMLLCVPVSAEIRKGDSSENVAELQRMLLELGFLEDEPDGSYGQKTEAAVKLFQTYCGLKADGRASDDLVAMVFDLYAGRGAQGPVSRFLFLPEQGCLERGVLLAAPGSGLSFQPDLQARRAGEA